MARRARPVAGSRSDGARRLDSRGAGGMGRAMAAPMIPPDVRRRFPRPPRLGRRADRAARRRRQLPPLFPHPPRRRPPGGADGRAAAARGSAPVRRGRRWLASVGLSAPDILAGDLEQGLLLLDDLGDARMREALDADPEPRARALRDSRSMCWSTCTAIRRWPGCRSHGLDAMADEAEAVPRLVLPAVGLDVDVDGWRRRLARGAGAGRRRRPWRRSPCCATIMPRMSCCSTAATGVAHFGLLDFQDALAGPSGL